MDEPVDFEENRPAKRMKLVSAEHEHQRRSLMHSEHRTKCEPIVQPRRPKEPQQDQDTKSQPKSRPHWHQYNQAISPSTLQQPQCLIDHEMAPHSSIDMAPIDPTSGSPNHGPWQNDTAFDPSWRWPLSSSSQPQSAAEPVSGSRDTVATDRLDALPLSVAGAPGVAESPFAALEIPAAPGSEYYPSGTPDSLYPPQQGRVESGMEGSMSLPSSATAGSPHSNSTFIHGGYAGPQTMSNTALVRLDSPFRDCIGTFGIQKSQYFLRPVDGKVNGYIKFSWPKGPKGSSTARSDSISDATRVVELKDASDLVDESASQTSMSSKNILAPSRASPENADTKFEFTMDAQSVLNFFAQSGSTTNATYDFPSSISKPFSAMTSPSTEVASIGPPRLVPSQYGYDAPLMDQTDRKFFAFYILNWCPGRSVLQDTNLWLKDFAQMQSSSGVLAAIQSLAGIYIYDYLPLDPIRDRVNQRFMDAEKRFTQLLQDPHTAQNEAQANELLTIATILSMQDIILTERRLKRPYTPRWLEGFRRGEYFLQANDHGSRFWNTENIQSSSLRTSQSIMVGRAIILAQPMSRLPSPEEFDAEKEASRFGWLLYGTEKDMYQIHGGCGFSKKLLHIFSQVTYCGARLQQAQESPIVPMTADYLLTELLNTRQWSPESIDWDVVKVVPPVVEWVRAQPEGYAVHTNANMTDVTAEAWRIAAIIYLQCRVFRLPRNHPEVVLKLDDLARCISIMPTSGSQFTAQAPLFPVFLLGMTATVPEHKAVSVNWFDQVLETPVRSSVPPLYNALRKIWNWIDNEIPLSLASTFDVSQPIHLRHAWWETLVRLVQEQEQEILCLT